jgi:heterodisulfide reductase subunit C
MNQQSSHKSDTIRACDRDLSFIKEVNQRSGQCISLCWHCNTCAGGCPFSKAMDYNPNEVLRLVQLGLRDEALRCSSIWLCVGCNTCNIQCPNSIDIPAVNTALREMAIESGIEAGEPNVLMFHRAFLDTVRKYGKMHELELMMRCKWKMRNWLADLDIGLKLLTRGRMELLPHRCRNMRKIKDLFEKKGAGGQR